MWEQRREAARKAAKASARARQQRQAALIRHIEAHGKAVLLPSGRTAHVDGRFCVILSSLVGRQPSGRIKAYELDGCRVMLPPEDRKALDQLLDR